MQKRQSLDDVVTSAAARRLRAFRGEVAKALDGDLAEVILFGSHARGDARPDSDYDVAVIVHRVHDRHRLNTILSDIAYPFLLQGFLISPVVAPADTLADKARQGIAASLTREGVAVR